jgi:ribosomal protein S8
MNLYTTSSFNRLIANINVGIAKRNKSVRVPYCNFNEKILTCLSRLGYLQSYSIVIYNGERHFLVYFKFDVNGRQCLQNLRRIRYLDRQINFKNKLVKDLVKGQKVFKGTWLVYTYDSILTDDEASIRDLYGVRFLLIN